jgi:hypothetical protein
MEENLPSYVASYVLDTTRQARRELLMTCYLFLGFYGRSQSILHRPQELFVTRFQFTLIASSIINQSYSKAKQSKARPKTTQRQHSKWYTPRSKCVVFGDAEWHGRAPALEIAFSKIWLLMSSSRHNAPIIDGNTPGISLTHILSIFRLQPSRDEYNKGKIGIPETQGTADGSAKRNITRKHDHDPHRYVPCNSCLDDASIECIADSFLSLNM